MLKNIDISIIVGNWQMLLCKPNKIMFKAHISCAHVFLGNQIHDLGVTRMLF